MGITPTDVPPDCALARLDPLQLAWAAGFFDGEGSTFVSGRKDRPGYLRLDLAVPQAGHDGTPQVLTRLQAALLGMGRIGSPNEDDVYLWRPNGFAEAQAAIALLWPHLNTVKRSQAIVAMRRVHEQYTSGRYLPRGPRRARRTHARHAPACASRPSARGLELAWAAGFLDAEGCFGVYRSMKRKKGPPWRRIRVSASQHGAPDRPAGVLLRLQRILAIGRVERHGEADDHKWLVEGANRVEAVLTLVQPWLGHGKIEQARAALEAFRSQIRLKGTATHCIRGHTYARVAIRGGRLRKICTACARIYDRAARTARRARQGVSPRQFKNLARRYTF